MSAINAHPFPKALLFAGATVAIAALGFTAAHRLANWGEPSFGLSGGVDVTAPIAADRAIAFVDLPDGALAVRDRESGAEITAFAPGEAGFVRGVLRALSRDHVRRGADQGPVAYRVVAFETGALALIDEERGRKIDLGAFGADNRASFAALLGPPSDDVATSDGSAP